MQDKFGFTYANIDDIKVGDILLVDGDFECMKPWSLKEVFSDEGGFYLRCNEGKHYLYEDEDGYVVGVYLPYHIVSFFDEISNS